MKFFAKLTVFLVAFLSGFFCYSSPECEQAKHDILVQCDEIEEQLITITNNLTTAKRYFDGTYVEKFSDPYGGDPTYSPLNSQDLYDSQGNSLGLRVSDLFYYVNNSLGLARYNFSAVQAIRDSVNAVQCSGSNTCNCAEYLAPISQDVAVIMADVNGMYMYVIQIEAYLNETLTPFLEQSFENIFEYHNYVTNLVSRVMGNEVGRGFFSYLRGYLMNYQGNILQPQFSTGSVGAFYDLATYSKTDSITALRAFMPQNLARLQSLNNYFRSNTFTIASIHKSSISNNVALGTVSRLLDRGFDSVTNQFSIFIGASAGASPVLGAYTENDGSYHDYLTNYYIKVSGSSVSGSTPLTNWFNRIEMLLAALVFQDDDGPNTNSVPPSSSFDHLDSELTQNMTTINQQGQDYLKIVDTSGKSLLTMLGEWNSAVSGVAKPSSFVIASIPTQASSPTRSSSGGSGSSLDITLDTDNESLNGFIELVRGVTTLAWVTLFLVVGYFLSIRIITLIGKLISFGYSVYSAVFGGG